MKKKIKKLSPLTEASFYILLVLQNPLHGYGIRKEVEVITKGRLVLAAGTLYGVIQNFLNYKLITLYGKDTTNRNKKEYKITEEGNLLLKYEIKRLKEMIRNTKKVIKDAEEN